MCLGVPGMVVKVEAAGALPSAVVEFAGVRRQVCMACVPEAAEGDYVIVHAGIAISRIDAAEARRTLALLDELGDDERWRDAPPEIGDPSAEEGP